MAKMENCSFSNTHYKDAQNNVLSYIGTREEAFFMNYANMA